MAGRNPDGTPSIRRASVVVPTLDGARRLAPLVERIDARHGTTSVLEVILVDDGSRDDTWAEIIRLVVEAPGRVGVRLVRNVGQVGATLAGFSIARGDVLVMIDDDLDTDPSGIDAMVAAVSAGADFASGTRQHRNRRYRKLGSDLYNRRIRSLGMPFIDAGCGMNAMSPEVAAHLVGLGWGARGLRFKPRVLEYTTAVVNTDVATHPTSESHYRLWDLAASCLDIELLFGGLTRLRFVSGFIAVPLAAAGAVLWRTPRSAPALAAASCAAGVGLASTAILARREGTDRATRRRPPFEIAEIARYRDAVRSRAGDRGGR